MLIVLTRVDKRIDDSSKGSNERTIDRRKKKEKGTRSSFGKISRSQIRLKETRLASLTGYPKTLTAKSRLEDRQRTRRRIDGNSAIDRKKEEQDLNEKVTVIENFKLNPSKDSTDDKTRSTDTNYPNKNKRRRLTASPNKTKRAVGVNRTSS